VELGNVIVLYENEWEHEIEKSPLSLQVTPHPLDTRYVLED
jgi:hypothetical protein